MIDDSHQLGAFLREEALRCGAHLAFNSHYDAQNWQLSWWRGATFHRLDFQPLDDRELSVTHYSDHFRFFPRVFRWAHQVIPLFPYLAQIELGSQVKSSFLLREEQIAAIVSRGVRATSGLPHKLR